MIEIPFALLPCNDTDKTSGQPFNIKITGRLSIDAGTASIQYLMSGDIANVKFPPVAPQPQRRENLWQTTCFELFVSATDSKEYWEYNLSPSHDWAVFHFSDYRQNKSDDLATPDLTITTQRTNNKRFDLGCTIELPQAVKSHKMELGVSAVVQNIHDQLYYYALIHCKKTADFHHRDSFIIGVEPANV
ncbi:MAG: DOMON-like domain-containing protein [Gammaproteobacteria bacterium]|jgi:hypothetical protein